MRFSAILLFAIVLNGCSSPDIDDYTETSPDLDLRQFLNGNLVAYGMLQDRSGKMTRRFTAEIQANWDGDKGVLNETFYFDDGEIQQRIWYLVHAGEGVYGGSASDVEGTASGSTRGAVFHWQYYLQVPWREGSIAVHLDDWLFLVDERHLLNRTKLTKFGFKVGELTLLIEKL